MFGLGAGEILIILVIAFLLFGPKQLPEVGRQVGKAVKGFKETADDLRKSVEPELNMIQQEVKMVEQDFQASMKEAEEEINQASSPSEKQSGSSGTSIGGFSLRQPAPSMLLEPWLSRKLPHPFPNPRSR